MMQAILEQGLTKMGVQPPPQGVSQLTQYGAMLVEQNQVMNLTAITQPKDVATLHMLDSAALLTVSNLEGKSLIDVGTGAGFPGMVLKILCPTLRLTLLDGLNKRLEWLEQVGDTLGLEGITTLHTRGEEGGHDPLLREQFDVATARAVADLRVLCELCLPFVKVGGQFLAMKSTAQEELDSAHTAIATLGGQLSRVVDYTIPHTDVTHRIVVIDKVAPTPEKYPRRWAKLQKSPL